MVDVRYKTRRNSPNPRAAKLRETGYFYHALNHAADIKYGIEKLSTQTETAINDLKPITVPAGMLWFLLDTYMDAYELLLKENLIKSGNISKIQSTIH